MTFLIGLTGSIGMGKSATAGIFASEGCAVWDADAAVHRLYAPGGLGVAPMTAEFPDAVIEGAVSRDVLRETIQNDASALKRIEAIVHPLVAADRQAFITSAQSDIVVLDVPLLFETGNSGRMDAIVVVSAPEEVQRARVMARGTMSEDHFEMIKAKQTPDAEKRARADYVVITDTPENAKKQVRAILADIRDKMNA